MKCISLRRLRVHCNVLFSESRRGHIHKFNHNNMKPNIIINYQYATIFSDLLFEFTSHNNNNKKY